MVLFNWVSLKRHFVISVYNNQRLQSLHFHGEESLSQDYHSSDMIERVLRRTIIELEPGSTCI